MMIITRHTICNIIRPCPCITVSLTNSTRSLRPSAADHPSLFSPTKTRHLSGFRSSEQAETKRVLDPGSRRSQNTPWMTSEDAPTKRIRQASLEIGSGILSLRFGCAFARAPADRLLSGARALRLGRDPPRADRTPPPFPAGTSRTNLHAPRDSSQKLQYCRGSSAGIALGNTVSGK